QRFARIRQGQYQRVITPGSVIGDIHPLFALAGGFNQKAIHVDDGLLEESGRLARPDLNTRIVEDVLQDADAGPVKASTEIPCRGRIRDTACAQGIEEDLVVAENFQIFDTSAATQRQIGQGEHVVRFMVREVDLQQREAAVDGVNEPELAHERVDGADTADRDAPAAFGNLIVDVAGSHHGFRAATQVGFVQAPLNAALAVRQFLPYD